MGLHGPISCLSDICQFSFCLGLREGVRIQTETYFRLESSHVFDMLNHGGVGPNRALPLGFLIIFLILHLYIQRRSRTRGRNSYLSIGTVTNLCSRLKCLILSAVSCVMPKSYFSLSTKGSK